MQSIRDRIRCDVTVHSECSGVHPLPIGPCTLYNPPRVPSEPPQVERSSVLARAAAPLGQEATLVCRVRAAPAADIQWTRTGRQIEPADGGGRYSVTHRQVRAAWRRVDGDWCRQLGGVCRGQLGGAIQISVDAQCRRINGNLDRHSVQCTYVHTYRSPVKEWQVS